MLVCERELSYENLSIKGSREYFAAGIPTRRGRLSTVLKIPAIFA